MSKIEAKIATMPDTTVFVGSEGDIAIRENGATIRILTAEQARDFARALEAAADHTDGKLIGGDV